MYQLYIAVAWLVVFAGISYLVTKRAHRNHENRIHSLEERHADVVSRGFPSCYRCGNIVARYFIGGDGSTICANCSPEGYQQAVKDKSAVGV